MSKHALIGTILLAGLILVGCGETEQRAETKAPGRFPSPQNLSSEIRIQPSGERIEAPQISGVDLQGRSWSLAEQEGKVVLVDFWATWCPPCRGTIPHLAELQRELGPEGFEIIGISLDRGGNEAVEPIARQLGVNYPVIVDPQGRYAQIYGGVQSIPTFFLVDRQGKLAAHVVGGGPKGPVEEAVRALLNEG